MDWSPPSYVSLTKKLHTLFIAVTILHLPTMCGISGVALADTRSNTHPQSRTGIEKTIWHPNAAALELLEASYCLQHRGQDACGIATVDHYENRVHRLTGLGLLTDVFNPSTGAENLMEVKGELGVAHSTCPRRTVTESRDEGELWELY